MRGGVRTRRRCLGAFSYATRRGGIGGEVPGLRSSPSLARPALQPWGYGEFGESAHFRNLAPGPPMRPKVLVLLVSLAGRS